MTCFPTSLGSRILIQTYRRMVTSVCVSILLLVTLGFLGMSLTRNCYIRVVGLTQLIVIGDAGRRLYITIGRSVLDKKYVQGWRFSSLFFRLCWLHVPMIIGFIASIFLVFNDQQIAIVARGLIQAASKSLGVSVLFSFS